MLLGVFAVCFRAFWTAESQRQTPDRSHLGQISETSWHPRGFFAEAQLESNSALLGGSALSNAACQYASATVRLSKICILLTAKLTTVLWAKGVRLTQCPRCKRLQGTAFPLSQTRPFAYSFNGRERSRLYIPRKIQSPMQHLQVKQLARDCQLLLYN
jgi:hypothetical protein